MKNIFLAVAVLCTITLSASSVFGGDKPRDRRKMIAEAKRCVDCHTKESPGIVNDWELSQHARAGITCLDCHKADRTDPDVQLHEKSYIAVIVSPKDCSRCHPGETREFNESHHSKAAQFIKSMDEDEKNDNYLAYVVEGKAAAIRGCEQCHGSQVKVMKNGVLDPETWPNSGIGRVNPDGSKGSCTACHTRHKFSIGESRKPESCGTCHIGPDHPQIEIYMESKHGVIYQAEGDEWNWDVAGSKWNTQYYRAPTCATCHMSGIGKNTETTHNVSERLSWRLGAPLSVARKDWQENRKKMQAVCLNCHSKNWVTGFYEQADNAVKLYNNKFFKPIKAEMTKLYKEGLLTKEKFDEELEYKYFEFWHHEGRRARMGAFMMGPDYTQWHGFYELAKNKLEIENTIKEIREKKHK